MEPRDLTLQPYQEAKRFVPTWADHPCRWSDRDHSRGSDSILRCSQGIEIVVSAVRLPLERRRDGEMAVGEVADTMEA
jgi:hypothetical protein